MLTLPEAALAVAALIALCQGIARPSVCCAAGLAGCGRPLCVVRPMIAEGASAHSRTATWAATATLFLMAWRVVSWLVLAAVQRRVALAGELDRERATARLREGYAGGQLTLDEFSRRTGRALSARSRWQLRRSLFGLSGPSLVDSVRDSVHDMVLAVITGAYVVFSLVLLAALALTLLINGVAFSAFVVVLLVWLVPTAWILRLRHRHTR
jgi:hypothetical protein